MSEVLHPEETVTTFYLARHGETAATEQGKLYTDYEAPLTDTGRDQARALAHYFASKSVDGLVSSPSKRVLTTAQIISEEIGFDPDKIAGLNEWHVGDWEGKTYLEIKKSEPENYQEWLRDPIHHAPPNGESVADMAARARKHLLKLLETYAGKRVCLVTHAGIVRSILVHALGMPIENFWRISVPTGSVSKVDFSANFATVGLMAYRPSSNSKS